MNDDDDRVIRQRIASSSIRAIAKACGTSVAEVNRIIDDWAETAVNHEVSKQTLALELAGLDQLQLVFHQRACKETSPPDNPGAWAGRGSDAQQADELAAVGEPF